VVRDDEGPGTVNLNKATGVRPTRDEWWQSLLGPSATSFRAGEEIRVVIAGRWLRPTNPLTGQFPAHYQKGPKGRATLHWGPGRPAALTVPVIPGATQRSDLQKR